MLKRHFVSISYALAAIVFGAFALLEESEILDIAIHEIYLVIPRNFIWLALVVLFALFSGFSVIFELLKKPINKYLFGIHYFFTIAGIVGLFLLLDQQTPPTHYVEYSVSGGLEQSDEEASLVQWGAIAVYTLGGAQLIFILNSLLSFFRKSTHQTL